MKHPKAITRIVNGISLVMAFNQGIGNVVQDFQSGTLMRDPAASLKYTLFKETGIDANTGSIDAGQATTSALSKVAAYAFNKTAKYFLKRFKV